ncbi:PepSY-associated TM helix domain-containing protein [Sphingomonas sp. KR1UV-12]|uniref:PepSY-associated TM helix domain-containing protein n=1 Tax=Sphingomonas aurea TaxID=3063994 RepID=A0ABT9EI17_9SPHN|nr:PepSY-associated TM helix domain-containing protein [Sphingomonas sp. KR1UV-12]MDP1026480.1 PepSY-associated TM helix domain-containing protein [Sphingomonas sp. KR1UV-12]
MSRQALRVTVRRWHLWLGITLGGLFALVGLTGSALVFYPELERAFSEPLHAVPAGTRPRSWQAVLDTLHREHPERTGAWRIEVTAEGGAIPIRYYDPPETRGPGRFAPLLLWIDPVQLTTIRAGFWGRTVVTWLYDLHYRLLLDAPGGTALGILGIAMLGLIGSGLWAWWPRPGSWRRALRFKRDAAAVRRLYDLHKVVGLASVGLLLLVTATGVMLDLPDQTRAVIGRVSPLYRASAVVTVPRGAMLSLDALARIAQARMPDGALAWIETPAGPRGTVRVNLSRPGEPSRRFPRTNVWLDPYDGRIVAYRDGLAETGGDTVLDWLHPLHGGEAAGMAGRVLIFLSGLAPTMLFVTGWLRWRRRGRQRRSMHLV